MFVLGKGIQDNYGVFPLVACSLEKECYDIYVVSNGKSRNSTGGVFHVCCKAYFLERAS